jgi:hypothetical protein
VVGYILMATAVLVTVPVVLQVARREQVLSEAWKDLLLAVGIFTVGIAYAFVQGQGRVRLTIVGLAAVLVGFLIGPMRRQGVSRGGR